MRAVHRRAAEYALLFDHRPLRRRQPCPTRPPPRRHGCLRRKGDLPSRAQRLRLSLFRRRTCQKTRRSGHSLLRLHSSATAKITRRRVTRRESQVTGGANHSGKQFDKVLVAPSFARRNQIVRTASHPLTKKVQNPRALVAIKQCKLRGFGWRGKLWFEVIRKQKTLIRMAPSNLGLRWGKWR